MFCLLLKYCILFCTYCSYELTDDREDDGVKKSAQPVMRRGQPFDIVVTFDRAFDKAKDDIRLVFTVGRFDVV